MFSLTTTRSSSRSSMMKSWLSLSIFTMMDLMEGSHSMSTPTKQSRVSEDSGHGQEVGQSRRRDGVLRTSDCARHGDAGLQAELLLLVVALLSDAGGKRCPSAVVVKLSCDVVEVDEPGSEARTFGKWWCAGLHLFPGLCRLASSGGGGAEPAPPTSGVSSPRQALFQHPFPAEYEVSCETTGHVKSRDPVGTEQKLMGIIEGLSQPRVHSSTRAERARQCAGDSCPHVSHRAANKNKLPMTHARHAC